jgi:hypothetical protein
MYSLVLDKGQKVRDKQLRQLEDHADRDVYTLTLRLMPEMDGLDIKYRLPLIDIAIPALKQLSISQYESFRHNLLALIETDSRIDLLEWSLQKILFNHLDAQFFKLPHTKAVYSHPGQIKNEVAVILSVMAYAGQQNQGDVEKAFDSAVQTLELNGLAPGPGKTGEIEASGETSITEGLRSQYRTRPAGISRRSRATACILGCAGLSDATCSLGEPHVDSAAMSGVCSQNGFLPSSLAREVESAG